MDYNQRCGVADNRKFGFVSICGMPNAGKSTLLNGITGEKVAAVSRKPQTTRFNILAVVEPAGFCDTQIAFVDTPGICPVKTNIQGIMQKHTTSAMKTADISLFVVDVLSGVDESKHAFEDILRKQSKNPSRKFIVAFNKTDVAKKETVCAAAINFQEFSNVSDFFMVSAKTGNGIAEILGRISELLPHQPWLYPHKLKGDIQRWAAEMTMEQIFSMLREELPYQTYVEPVSIGEEDDGMHIYQDIVVAKESQKKIIVGERGVTLKEIGTNARLEIARSMHRRVHLHLFVKVRSNWMSNEAYLRDAGFRTSIVQAFGNVDYTQS
jgi:GTP-binding protein Era